MRHGAHPDGVCDLNNIRQFKFLRASSPEKFSGSREAPAPSAPLNPSSECWKTDGSAAE